MVHPEDLPLTIFDLHPNRPPQPLLIDSETAVTYMYVEMHAFQEDWSTDGILASM